MNEEKLLRVLKKYLGTTVNDEDTEAHIQNELEDAFYT